MYAPLSVRLTVVPFFLVVLRNKIWAFFHGQFTSLYDNQHSCVLFPVSKQLCIHQGCHQEVGARYFPSYFQRKIEEKISSEIPSYLIPRLLVVPSRQLKILVTALYSYMFCEEDLYKS